MSLSVGGSGTNQQKLNLTRDNWWGKDYKLVYTVTLPYTPSGGGPIQTKTVTWERTRTQPKTVTVGGEGEGIAVSNTVVGRQYFIENSATMQPDSWATMQSFTGNSGTIIVPMPHKGNPLFPRMFYRVRF